jgi:hypothetical protein
MKRLSLFTLIFAVLSLVFIVLLVFLRLKFPLYPLVSYQDVFDILTPLALIPVYWLLFRHSASDRPSQGEEILFLVPAALWVEGHGIHLSSNSIDNLFDALARNPATNLKASDVYRLTFFFDEELGHYIWHVGMLSMVALLLCHEWRRPKGSATIWWEALLAGIIYGFAYFCIFVQARTVFLGLPFATIVVLVALIWGRKRLAKQPVLAFFSVASLVAFLLFAGWWLYWGAFPQFTALGWI